MCRAILIKIFFGLALCTGWFKAHCQPIDTRYEFFGFSEDERFVAYEMYAWGRKEGDPSTSVIYFVDVEKNDYAARPVRLEDPDGSDEGLARLRIAIRRKAEPLFQQFKISGNKLGWPIHINGGWTKSRGYYYDSIQSFERGINRIYTLRLSQVKTGQTLNGKDEVMAVVELEHDGKTTILQQATTAPKSWGFITGYQFLEAYYLENKIAIIIEYKGPGSEGKPDRQQMIVTGILYKE